MRKHQEEKSHIYTKQPFKLPDPPTNQPLTAVLTKLQPLKKKKEGKMRSFHSGKFHFHAKLPQESAALENLLPSLLMSQNKVDGSAATFDSSRRKDD